MTQLYAQTVNESRAAGNLNHDIGLLRRYVRQTGVGIDWITQAINAIEHNSDRIQQLASLSGAAIDPLDDPSASSSLYGARPASASLPRHAPMVTRPLEGDMRLPMDADAGYAAGPAASDAMQRTPGTLRVSDLVGFDALGGSGMIKTRRLVYWVMGSMTLTHARSKARDRIVRKCPRALQAVQRHGASGL